ARRLPATCDRFSGDGCESFHDTRNLQPPPFPPPPRRPSHVTPPPSASPPSAVTIRGGKVNVRRGRASIRVSCPASSPANCTGSLVLRVGRGGKLARHTIGVQPGRARYDLSPGRSRPLALRPARARRRLAGP